MNNKSVLILGAASDVGRALANVYNTHGYNLILAARNLEDVESYVSKWTDRKQAVIVPFDARDFQNHKTWFRNLPTQPNITICVFGYLGNQSLAETNWEECETIIDSNYSGAVSILNVIAEVYADRKNGTIVGISSVGGERGRQSNYIYGSAKAGFTAYLSGLRNKLFPSGVHVLTVKPGFIDTKMTAGLNLPKPITAKPDQVAKRIHSAIERKNNVIYVLSIWFWIMLVIRLIPEFIFKRLKL
jgi:decaprenylphospho-beta-D-erythro-pentofuranosid-2-ulose 2-reductase